MSTVAGLATGNEVYMAADSLCTDSEVFVVHDDVQKVFKRGVWTIGVVGTTRIGNLLRSIPHCMDECRDIWAVCCRLKDMMNNDGFAPRSDDQGGPQTFEAQFIVTDGRVLYDVSSSLSWHEVRKGRVFAIGSGADFVHGADHVLQRLTHDPADRIEMCVGAAIARDPRSGGPVVITKVERNTLHDALTGMGAITNAS